MDRVVLYRNAKHGISLWEIWQEENVIHMRSEAKLGDHAQRYTEVIHSGKAGRSFQQQVDLRMEARIRNKRDNGYVDTKEAAKDPLLTNTLGYLQPMLAQKFKDLKNPRLTDYYYQYKYDGHRCMITNHNGELIAYSRAGRRINTVNHILKDIKIPEGVTLDGELYYHGVPLQTIASWAKRLQAKTELLTYVLYDIADPNLDNIERMRIIRQEFHFGYSVVIARTFQLHNSDELLYAALSSAISSGFEGLILRKKDFVYEVGRRSKGLIKLKKLMDNEVKVIDVILADKGDFGVLVCETDAGVQFKVSAPGTMPQKRHAYDYKQEYIGQHVTIEYPNLTKDGKPFHAVALRWRIDL